MSRNWGKNSEYSTTVIYVMTIGGSVVALLALLGAIYLVDIVRAL